MEQSCFSCHSNQKAESDFNLEEKVFNNEIRENADLLDQLEWVISEHEMPPKKAAPALAEADREILLSWIDHQIHELASANPHDPGRVIMPRLTRSSYERVIHDLTGIAFDAENYLQQEGGAGEGFTNVGEAQSLSVGQMEQFLGAAAAVLDHVRIGPTSGLNWAENPRRPAGSADELRAAMALEWVDWHQLQEHFRVEEHPEILREALDMDLGAYLEAAWIYRHREALGLPGADFAQIAGSYQPRLMAHPLEMFWKLLHDESDRGGLLVAELKQRWHALPTPASGPDAALTAREGCREIDHWLRELRAQPFNRSRIIDDRFVDREEMREALEDNRYPIMIPAEKVANDDKDAGAPKRVFVLIASCGDQTNADDVVILENGQFLYGEMQDKRGAERYAKMTTKPWEQVVSGWQQQGTGEVRFGSTPLSGKNSLAVQAPAALALDLPADAGALQFQIRLPKEHAEKASVQIWVTDDMTPFQKDNPPVRYSEVLPGAVTLGGNPKKAFTNSLKTITELYPRKHRYPGGDLRHLYMDNLALDRQYLGSATWDQEPRNPLEDDLVKPFEMRGSRVRADAFPPADAEIAQMQADLMMIAQVPHQQLATLLQEAGQSSLPEGSLPSPEQLNALAADRRAEAEKLAEEIRRQELAMRDAAHEQIAAFALRAWRGKVDEEQMRRLMALYEMSKAGGASYDTAVKQALKLVLISPRFLYQLQTVETDAKEEPLSGRELAVRLAFFLWNSIPDQELLELGAAGTLNDPQVLRGQIARMLQDPRSRSLAEDFAGQWFGFAGFESHSDPDGDLFPHFDEEIRKAMKEEAVRFFDHLFTTDAPVTDVVLGDYTFLNEELAQYYGIPGVKGEEFRRVDLGDHARGGVLGLGAVLTKTSAPARTSPVLRGVWLLEQVLGVHLPSPPPNVPLLSDGDESPEGLSIPEQLAKHRADPNCMSCHQRIDPLGLALENFDPVGRWRDKDSAGNPVITRGETGDGTVIDGVEGLRQHLAGEKEKILEHFSRKLLGYALGRAVLPTDKPLLDQMQATFAAQNYRLAPVIEQIVTSKQFQNRKNQEA